MWTDRLVLAPAASTAPRRLRRRGTAAPPNVVLIVADDLGYGDVGLLRREGHPHAEPRPAGDGGHAVHQLLRRPAGLHRVPGRPADRLLPEPRRHGRGPQPHEHHRHPPGRDAAAGTAQGEGLRHGPLRQVAPRHTGPPFLPTRHGFDEFVGLPYSNDNGPLHPTVRGIPPLPLYDDDKVDRARPGPVAVHAAVHRAGRRVHRGEQGRAVLPVRAARHAARADLRLGASSRGSRGRGLYGDVVEELDWSVGEILDGAEGARPGRRTRSCSSCPTTGRSCQLRRPRRLGRPAPRGEADHVRGRRARAVHRPLAGEGARRPRVRRADHRRWTCCPTLAKLVGAELPKAQIDGDGPVAAAARRGRGDAAATVVLLLLRRRAARRARAGEWKLHLPHEYLTVDGPPGKDGKPANFENMKPERDRAVGPPRHRQPARLPGREDRAVAVRPDGRPRRDDGTWRTSTRTWSSNSPDWPTSSAATSGDPLTGVKGNGLRTAGPRRAGPRNGDASTRCLMFTRREALYGLGTSLGSVAFSALLAADENARPARSPRRRRTPRPRRRRASS